MKNFDSVVDDIRIERGERENFENESVKNEMK